MPLASDDARLRPAPRTWAECLALLRELPPEMLVVAAEEAARSVLPRWSESPGSADDAPARALAEVARWRAGEAGADALKSAAEAAYRAASASAHSRGSPAHAAGLAAAHAAFAALFLARGNPADRGRRVFGAAADACGHASAAAGSWGAFSADWTGRWWGTCLERSPKRDLSADPRKG